MMDNLKKKLCRRGGWMLLLLLLPACAGFRGAGLLLGSGSDAGAGPAVVANLEPAAAGGSELLELLTTVEDDERESAFTVFLSYLEELGASPSGVMPDSAADVEIEIQARTGARYQFPLVMNARVRHFISAYSTVQSGFMHRSLARSHRYLGMMRKILREHDIPEELAYMVLVESGFTTHAYSRARASGPWQFISSTGRRYGLKIDSWVDERRDPVKATYAAAAYLADLYAMFESWYLAAAAYNAGEGKIQRAMRRYQTEDFWHMSSFRYLKRETKDYIPRLLAAIMIAREPEKYGFADIEYEEPFAFDIIRVDDATDLQAIAWAAGVKPEELRELNPELSYWCTPPRVSGYELRVPAGRGEDCAAALVSLPPEKRITFRRHKIRPGDTLSEIARFYRTGVEQIKELNGLRNSCIRAGRELLVPVRVVGQGPVVFDRAIYAGGIPASGLGPARPQAGSRTSWTVRSGDSLWKIARRSNLKVEDLQRWNGLGPSTRIKPGQVLRLRPAAAPERKIAARIPAELQKNEPGRKVVTLEKGDTLWRIARRYRVKVSDLERWNRLGTGTILQPGQQLVLFQ